jgi:hypothetical protein
LRIELFDVRSKRELPTTAAALEAGSTLKTSGFAHYTDFAPRVQKIALVSCGFAQKAEFSS